MPSLFGLVGQGPISDFPALSLCCALTRFDADQTTDGGPTSLLPDVDANCTGGASRLPTPAVSLPRPLGFSSSFGLFGTLCAVQCSGLKCNGASFGCLTYNPLRVPVVRMFLADGHSRRFFSSLRVSPVCRFEPDAGQSVTGTANTFPWRRLTANGCRGFLLLVVIWVLVPQLCLVKPTALEGSAERACSVGTLLRATC